MIKILVVDDDKTIRSPLSKFLRIHSYQVDEVSSGNEAIQKVTSEPYDVVLLDLILPDVSGLEVLKDIKKICPSLQVIMLSGFGTINTSVEAIKKGATEFISKPYNLEELENIIRKCLKEKMLGQSISKNKLDFTISSLSNPIRRNILKLLNENIGMHLMQITRELDIEDHTKVAFHLKILKDAALIEKNMQRSYTLTKEGNKVISSLNIIENHLLS